MKYSYLFCTLWWSYICDKMNKTSPIYQPFDSWRTIIGVNFVFKATMINNQTNVLISGKNQTGNWKEILGKRMKILTIKKQKNNVKYGKLKYSF